MPNASTARMKTLIGIQLANALNRQDPANQKLSSCLCITREIAQDDLFGY
jgi:hypothetical protein